MKRHLIPVMLFLLCILFSCKIDNLERTNPLDQKAGTSVYKPPPIPVTTIADPVSSTTATLNGTVNAKGTPTNVKFEWGTTTSYGSGKKDATPSSVSGTAPQNVSAGITGLNPDQTYHFRVIATSLNRQENGDDKQFKTLLTVSDNDVNIYIAITIGTQVWMNENLKTTKYNDGTSIPLVTDGTAWTNLTSPGYCWYNNNQATYKTTYGALYNWYAVNTGKLCPTGWHIPTDTEWTTLTTYLGGESVAGGELKETGTTHWTSTTAGTDNSSGFTALPGGNRNFDGSFLLLGNYGYWWSSSPDLTLTDNAWNRGMSNSNTTVTKNSASKKGGFSVRCVKN